MSQTHVGTAMVALSAAGFATLPIFMKFAFTGGANILTILGFRFILASIILWIILIMNHHSFHISAKHLFQLMGILGLGYGTMSFLYAVTVENLSASLSTLLLYTYPALVTVLSFLIGDERLSWKKMIALLICFSGLALILGISASEVKLIGLVTGFSAAFVYACYIIIGNRVLKQVESLVAATYVCTSSGILFVLLGVSSSSLIVGLPVSVWLALLGIAFLGTIVGIVGFFGGITRIGAANASIISTLEPVITVGLSVFLLGDALSVFQIVGGFLIIAGVFIIQFCDDTESTIISV
ncbi:DMT family transporter [Desulfitobacterium sp. AusDCA]|uniref:DMT family transporter n=1 Tax=Desulfitobacterium sp. AusDCA TaxID=3240383 RepID=UPI003DA6E831